MIDETGVLSQRVSLITGGTSGIGAGIARSLAREGSAVAITGLGDTAQIDKILGDLSALGARAEYYPADAQHAAQLAEMISRCEREFGPVDILVNCAGVQHVARIEEFPADKWDLILAVNLSAAFHTIRRVLAGMRTRQWGRIINVASVHGLVGSAEKSAYVASKHGLLGLTKVVALETADSPITCNAICPGWVKTPLVEAQITARSVSSKVTLQDAQASMLQEKQPSRRFVEIDQIGAMVAFLCSDAASEVRGAAWTVDGGWTAQ